MEETGLIEKIIRRIFRLPEMTFILSLAAMACLPIALDDIVRDAATSLLLPLTFIGILLVWKLVSWKTQPWATAIVLLVLGPLALFIRIGGISSSLFEIFKQGFRTNMSLFQWFIYKIIPDVTPLNAAIDEFYERIFAFASRLSLWFTSLLHGVEIQDPVSRTFVWGVVIWLIAIWAGWQIHRHGKYLLAIVPATIMLAFVLDYTNEKKEMFWLHLILLFFLLGISHFGKLRANWESTGTDYSDSTIFESIGMVSVLAFGLVALSYLASTTSIKDILEDFRKKQNDTTAQAESLGLEQATQEARHSSGGSSGPSLYYGILGGPELTNELIMTISTGDLPSMPASARPSVPRYYWRTQTYRTYSGTSWSNPPRPVEFIPSDQPLFTLPESGYRVVQQQVLFPNGGIRLYWTGSLVQANIPFEATRFGEERGEAFFDSNLVAAFASEESYQAESLLLNVDAQMLRESPPIYPDWINENYLTLPEAMPERVLALARDLTASERTPYDRVIAIQNYLREFPYTLDVPAPPSGRDAADFFLFDLKRGYCDYYATSMAVLARAAGIPSRLVVGYANGSYDTEQAKYFVTEKYKHAWVEIYFTNIGWIEFEPTASEPVIFYGETAGVNNVIQPVETNQPFRNRFASFLQNMNFSTPAILFGVLIFLWIVWDSLNLLRLAPAQTIQLLFTRLRRLSRPLSGPAIPYQTPNQYALILANRLESIHAPQRLQPWLSPSSNNIHQLTELYTASLFAPTSPSRIEAKNAIQTWRRLRWKLMIWNLIAWFEKKFTRGLRRDKA